MSNSQYSSIGSDNGLAPPRRQAIIWTNDGKFTDAYMRHSASMSFFNSYPPGQNGHQLADDIFRCSFLNEKFCILIQISLKFVPKGRLFKFSIGLDNGVAPNRWQAIIWTNADPTH